MNDSLRDELVRRAREGVAGRPADLARAMAVGERRLRSRLLLLNGLAVLATLCLVAMGSVLQVTAAETSAGPADSISRTGRVPDTTAETTSLAGELVVVPGVDALAVGETVKLVATIASAAGPPIDVSTRAAWTSSDPGVAPVDATGLVLAVRAGTATVTAAVDGLAASATLEVSDDAGTETGGETGTETSDTPSASLTSLAIAPASASAPVGTDVAFQATGDYSDESSREVTDSARWSAGDAAVATVGDNGVATCAGEGETQIQAELDTTVAVATLTCTPPVPTGVLVTPSTAEVAVDSSQEYEAALVFSDGSSEDVTSIAEWASSDDEVADMEVGVASCSIAGTTTITASFEDQVGRSELTCFENEVETVTIDPGAASAAVGDKTQFRADATFTDGSTYDYTQVASWATSDPDIAQVVGGLATCNTVGQVTITATIDEVPGTASLSCSSPPPPTRWWSRRFKAEEAISGETALGGAPQPGIRDQRFTTWRTAAGDGLA